MVIAKNGLEVLEMEGGSVQTDSVRKYSALFKCKPDLARAGLVSTAIGNLSAGQAALFGVTRSSPISNPQAPIMRNSVSTRIPLRAFSILAMYRGSTPILRASSAWLSPAAFMAFAIHWALFSDGFIRSLSWLHLPARALLSSSANELHHLKPDECTQDNSSNTNSASRTTGTNADTFHLQKGHALGRNASPNDEPFALQSGTIGCRKIAA